ncbi:PREDICTED: gibberellin 2-beta-dioxygenase 2-like [Populus euphratica]|uniref:gibberellin 2beta-dioxygenase n=1 Tax=Populus euphratica TaxID=75702 RepID=A0AAJ6XI25_POPEU|nr:PREDICTED: gibberellin 2-beta-dioxygenase 2-like [Populus euphratica]
MVVASPTKIHSEEVLAIELPTVDLSGDRSMVSNLIVKACEEYGFFKVKNHGVPHDIIAKMEKESLNFFAKPFDEKQKVELAKPFGYGCKNIGFNGDIGEVEYLLLSTNPLSIAERSKTISNDPAKFSSAVGAYMEAVRELACELLDLMAEGLRVPDRSVFSRLIRDVDSDSLIRLNHYPPLPLLSKDKDSSPCNQNKVGFGEHSDPQILTILRSNDVGGLQIFLNDGGWVPVKPDPATFWVNVGDLLQAMTNGRFVSVRHKALTNSYKSRMSMAYFAGPPPNARIPVPPEMITPTKPALYKPFTWAEFKKAAYALRLGDSRLGLFRMEGDEQVA